MNTPVTLAKRLAESGDGPAAARQRLLAATVELLRQGGLSAAGLNEVAERAQAPKGSLYHYFPGGKADLVAAALAHYAQGVAQRLDDALSAPTPLLTRATSVFSATADAMAATQFGQSCAVGAVTLDLGLNTRDGESDGLARSGMAAGATRSLREACAAALALWSATVAKRLPELAPPVRPAVGRAFVTLLEGAQLMARAQRSRQPLDDAQATFAALLQAQPLRRPISQ